MKIDEKFDLIVPEHILEKISEFGAGGQFLLFLPTKIVNKFS